MATPNVTFNGYATALPAGADLSSIGIFNVKFYGAKGDGTTDDSTAIQNAINACATNGGIVFFPLPSSAYLVSQTINVPGGVNLIGESAGMANNQGTVIKPTGAFTGTVLVIGPSSGMQYHARIENLTVYGNGANTAPLVVMRNTSWSKIMDLAVLSSGQHGLSLSNCLTNSFVNLLCNFNATYGLYINGPGNPCNQNVFFGGQFNNNNTSAGSGCGIYIQSSDGCRFIGSDIEANGKAATGSAAVIIDGSKEATFEACWLERNAGVATFYLANTVSTVSIRACNIQTLTANAPYDVKIGSATVSVIDLQANRFFGTNSQVLDVNNSPAVRSIANFSESGGPALPLIGKFTSQPTVPATTVAYTNVLGADAEVAITSGTSTCAVAIGGNAAFTIPASGIASIGVPNGQSITLTYTNAPTWTWFGR